MAVAVVADAMVVVGIAVAGAIAAADTESISAAATVYTPYGNIVAAAGGLYRPL